MQDKFNITFVIVKQNKVLILCTTGYPFGIIEDFLHHEVLFLSGKFDKIILIVPSLELDLASRKLPKNVEVKIHVLSKRRLSVLLLYSFWKVFFYEIANSHLKIWKLSHFKELVSFFAKGNDKRGVVEKVIRENQNSDIICYSYWLNESAMGLALLKEMPNVRCISRVHGWDMLEERHLINYLPFRKYIVNRLSQTIPISKFGENYLIENYKISKSKIEVSYLGTKSLKPQEYNVSETLRLITCSNLIPLKNIGLLIDALAKVDFSVSWTHIGNGSEYESLIQKATLNLPQNVFFDFKGEMQNDDIRLNYEENTYDLFINVSSYEGIPVSIMEALSAGIPILATAVGGTPEIVNERHGFLVKSTISANDLFLKIVEFKQLSNEKKYILRKNALEHWSNFFSSKKNHTAFYNQITNL